MATADILWTKATQSDLNKLQIESDKVNLVASLLINHHSTIFKDLAPPAAWLENPSLQTKFASGNKKSIQCFAQAGETVWSADSSGVIRIIDINVRDASFVSAPLGSLTYECFCRQTS